MARNAQPREFIDAMEGLDFPASQPAVQRKAHDKGGLDTEVIYVLSHLPDRTYDSMEDLAQEIERVYATVGGLEGAGPAAPSGTDARDKDAIESRSDTRAGELPGHSQTGPEPDLRG